MRQTAVQITKRFRWLGTTLGIMKNYKKESSYQENITVMVLITNEVREKQSNTRKKGICKLIFHMFSHFLRKKYYNLICIVNNSA